MYLLYEIENNKRINIVLYEIDKYLNLVAKWIICEFFEAKRYWLQIEN